VPAGSFLDPVGNWDYLVPPVNDTIAINWLMYKGPAFISAPQPDHPEPQGPWQKPRPLSNFTLDLINVETMTGLHVMPPTPIYTFWESAQRRGVLTASSPSIPLKNQRMEVYLLQNNLTTIDYSCPYSEFGIATYYWTPPPGTDRSPNYKWRLFAEDELEREDFGAGEFWSEEFKLGDMGMAKGWTLPGLDTVVGGCLVILLIVLGVFCVWWGWRGRHRYEKIGKVGGSVDGDVEEDGLSGGADEVKRGRKDSKRVTFGRSLS